MASKAKIIRLCCAALIIKAVCCPIAFAADEPPPGATPETSAPRTGEQIFQSMCAKCHGAAGEGTKGNHPDPLVGDKSINELARLIEKTMPEDDPGKCTGDDAKNVAKYIHEAFYSPGARMRNKPARVELSRLTVRQYQNVVTDLVAGFRGEPKWNDQRGVKATYFKTRNFKDQERAFERIDPTVDFDFGDVGPEENGHDSDKFDPHQFSIRWEGALLAPETGEYEFAIKTEHAARLWLNDMRGPHPLVDAWVKSGNDTEFSGTLRLQGGHVYPLRMEFSKANQGVDDSDKQKKRTQGEKATVELLWKLPHQAAEVIPERYLGPQLTPEVFVLQTPFPPDDRSLGYERGTSISKAWDQATTDAAIEAADYVTAHVGELGSVKESAADREARIKKFCGRFAERAFRRPLSPEQQARYVEHAFQSTTDTDVALKRAILLILKSPWFLYRELNENAESEQYDVAARLSFGLWDSLPDKDLRAAAKAGKLATKEQVTGQAQRMMPDLRTHAKLREFFWLWLKAEESPDLSKDAKQYPEFTPAVATDLRTSMGLFIEDIVWSDASDFRQVFLSSTIPINGRLAKYYGIDLPADAPFQDVPLDPDRRSGVLTHPYLLAAFAHATDTSPIRRGVFISRNLLGRALKPPPEAFTPLPAELHADLTTRERIALQTEPQACMICHSTINPLGFTLEQFDAAGRFRTEENGKPIDATGQYETRGGEVEQFKGVCDLAKFLAESDETHTAFVEQLFHHLIKQPTQGYGPNRLDELKAAFQQNGFSIQKLVSEMVTGAALPAASEKTKND